jgi:acyl-coenzyme A thioesterase PaaI-like protein
VCKAQVVHTGSRIATAEGRVFAEETGKLIAHGSATCMVLSPNGVPAAEHSVRATA